MGLGWLLAHGTSQPPASTVRRTCDSHELLTQGTLQPDFVHTRVRDLLARFARRPEVPFLDADTRAVVARVRTLLGAD